MLNEKNPNEKHGFSLLTATTFIIGEVAGGGLLSLPYAVSQASWSGLPMILFCGFCAGYSGLFLARCWLILEDRFPKYRIGLTRKPLATIASHAYGQYMSAFVSIIMNITRIGATAVFILLTSGLLTDLTESFIDLDLCKWAPIVTAILMIPLWLGSPMDFWLTAYGAMISTTLGSVILLAAVIRKVSNDGFRNDYSLDKFSDLASSFGTILFAFGGASAFPNFQNDMRDKSQFPKAVIFGFTGLLLLYLPTAGLGYAAFGQTTEHSILDNFESQSDGVLETLVLIVRICFLIHCITVILIVINPVFLDLEEVLKIPKPFNWKRCLFRTLLLIFMAFIGETFPNFGQILDLIGGSTITMTAFVLPPIFYMKLCSDSDSKDEREVPIYQKVIFVMIVISGIAGGAASTYSTLSNWAPLESACYINGGRREPLNDTTATTIATTNITTIATLFL